MTDEKVVGILQQDLENKLDSVDIIILSHPDIGHHRITCILIDDITKSKRAFDILEEEFVDLDEIHKAMKMYDIIIKEAQLLLNERYP